MVISKSTASHSPGAYRVDTEHDEKGCTYHVMNCQKVASFSDPELAAFPVDLLTKGGAHHG